MINFELSVSDDGQLSIKNFTSETESESPQDFSSYDTAKAFLADRIKMMEGRLAEAKTAQTALARIFSQKDFVEIVSAIQKNEPIEGTKNRITLDFTVDEAKNDFQFVGAKATVPFITSDEGETFDKQQDLIGFLNATKQKMTAGRVFRFFDNPPKFEELAAAFSSHKRLSDDGLNFEFVDEMFGFVGNPLADLPQSEQSRERHERAQKSGGFRVMRSSLASSTADLMKTSDSQQELTSEQINEIEERLVDRASHIEELVAKGIFDEEAAEAVGQMLDDTEDDWQGNDKLDDRAKHLAATAAERGLISKDGQEQYAASLRALPGEIFEHMASIVEEFKLSDSAVKGSTGVELEPVQAAEEVKKSDEPGMVASIVANVLETAITAGVAAAVGANIETTQPTETAA